MYEEGAFHRNFFSKLLAIATSVKREVCSINVAGRRGRACVSRQAPQAGE